jgi:hypothetical protein
MSSAKVTFAKVMVPAPSVIAIATLIDSTMRLNSALLMLLRPDAVDHVEEMAGGGMQGLLRAAQRRQHFPRDRLAQLHAPLVECVDAPERRLGENLVLVHRDQRSEVMGIQLRQDERRARPVAG